MGAFPFHPDVLVSWRQGLVSSASAPVFPHLHVGPYIFILFTKFGQCSPLICSVPCSEEWSEGESGLDGGSVSFPVILDMPGSL